MLKMIYSTMQTVEKQLGNVKLRKKELDILMHLRSNGRHTVTAIGRKLNVPRTTVFEKIKKFKTIELIKRFTCIPDFNKLGYSIYAYVLFKSDPAKKNELGEALQSSAHTNNVLKLGNEFDYLASLVFQNMEEMHSFLDILNSKYEVKDAKILYVTRDLKREGFLANSVVKPELDESAEEL